MLSFTHAGNRLSSVQSWDGANLPQIGTFTYDAMGNQLTDSRKGLQFCYNFANLPSKVEGSAGSGNAGLTLNYGYLSDGTKTSAIKETAAGSGAEGLKYRGSFVYETVAVPGSEVSEEFLSGIGWSEGRIAFDNPFEVAADSAAVEAVSLPDGLTVRLLAHGGVEEPGDTTETAASLLGTMHDLWYIADHLGNTRAVVDMTFGGFVAESNEYLPFGTRLDGALALPDNRHRFGGKEEQRFGIGAGILDLHLSDFGARYYDPFTARWTTRDPLAGKYAGYSPYSYCGGNPIRFTDRDGLDWKDKAKGYSIGVITNIVPGTSALRDAVTVTDASDFNRALERTDRASMVVGASMVGGGADMVAAGEYAAATGGAVALSGAGAPAGVVVATGGATLIAAGAATATAGTMLMANAGKNASEGYDRGTSGGSVNQMKQRVNKGQAPKSITRVDKMDGNENKQHHVHFKDGSALNKDGTWKHTPKKGGEHVFTNKEIEFLKYYGWTIPE